MHIRDFIDVASCIVALLALLVSAWSLWWIYRTSVRPVIVFFNDAHDANEKTTWAIQNVGNGPALNITLCGGMSLDSLDTAVCARIPALAHGSKERLSFLNKRLAFVATYTDLYGIEYTSTCFDSINQYYTKNKYRILTPNLPHAWTKTK